MRSLIYYSIIIFTLPFVTNLSFTNNKKVDRLATSTQRESDTLQIFLLNEMAEELFEDKESSLDNSLVFADSALKLSEAIGYQQGILRSALNIGKIKRLQREFKEGLNYYLKALNAADVIDEPKVYVNTYVQTASFYQEWEVIDKTLSYYDQALSITKKNNFQSEEESIIRYLAVLHQLLQNYDRSEKYYNELIELYTKRNDEEGKVSILEKLITLYMTSGKFNNALAASNRVYLIKQQQNDTSGIGLYLNKIGILHQKLKQYDAALNYFEQCVTLYKEVGKSPTEYAPILMSIGVVHQSKQEFTKAIENYEEVLSIRKAEDNKKEIANTLNYLVTIYMGLKDYDKSKYYCLQAIDVATEINDLESLEKNYLRLSTIYENSGSSKKALAAYKEYLKYKEDFYAEEKQRVEELTHKQLEAEKAEKDLKLLMADQQLKNLELSNLKVESEKKEQELAMLTQQKKLQESQLQAEQLEKDRVQQALKIAQQKLDAEQRDKAITDLKQAQELKDLALKQKELEEQEKMNTIALLENEKKLQNQKIQEEAKIKQYGIWMIGLCILVLIIISISFLMKQKANKKLKLQQMEIMEKNEELQAQEEEIRQNMEELQATQEDLHRSKSELENAYVELETKNDHLTDSIKYAKRIQTAILPPETDLKTVFPEHFVIYIPKDMVSGDFYWFSQQGNKSIIATVDCTGHGVPGAFMSMIGNAHLNQIVNEQKITDPAKILESMHYQVTESLNQKDSRNVDGMDLGIACIEKWEDGVVSLKYSGAKCPLFHYRNGEVKKLNPDRKSIGGWYEGVTNTFTNQVMHLEKGDIIYLTTDGFIDAANSKRRRFGSKRLKELIKTNGHKPTYEQKLVFENTLQDHQQNSDQRDDITFIALKI
ncbi:tetratricopeptide repeat protein [Chondrinema litorale]|uniref:tetratricopeptide repeat protein n=1 Tax=Chondrinema litorale TaxID=2994555 RepID=UPI0025436592|nr:tetratricopeptide repeat protein [Chondrinema litorale]UZR92788.1 tetratricopeptide repeat protein [Chondrinema litorale]